MLESRDALLNSMVLVAEILRQVMLFRCLSKMLAATGPLPSPQPNLSNFILM